MPDEKQGRIDLISAFGEVISADICRIPIAMKTNNPSCQFNTSDVLIAVSDKLSVPCILPPAVYDLLQTNADENYLEESHSEASTNPPPAGADISSPFCAAVGDEIFDRTPNVCLVSETNTRKGGQISEANEFRMSQEKCETLQDVRRQIRLNKGNYFIMDNLVFHKDKILGEPVSQLVLPKDKRLQVLRLAHESIFGNHLGVKKTKERIRYSFHWPNMAKDIEDFCKTCENCQLRSPEKSKGKISITPVVRPDHPFEVVNIDIIGPIEPQSARKHKYILCLMDQHSRWPEAVPLRSITAKSTCDALLEIFMRTGIPRVIASDQGSNFVSKLTQEFHARLGTHPRFSTPGYPASNGLVERYNKVLKQMLHHVIRTDPKNWDKHLPYLLFAYREIPNCTTGVSPFRLMYGREARGPLAVLKSTWSGEIPLPMNVSQSATDYLQELKMNLERAAQEAAIVAEGKQNAYADYFNRRTTQKEFKVGDQVCLLLPDSNNKIYARWIGPGEIVAHCNPHSYKVKLPDGKIRHVHVNKIRRFYPRVQAIGVVFESEREFGEIYSTPRDQITEEVCRGNMERTDFSHLDNEKKGVSRIY